MGTDIAESTDIDFPKKLWNLEKSNGIGLSDKSHRMDIHSINGKECAG